MKHSWWRDDQLRCKELVLVAMAFATLSLALSGGGYGTNEWTVVYVDRVKLKTVATEANDAVYLNTLKTDYNYFSRKRGLFETCFEDQNEIEFLKNETFYKGGKCLHEEAIVFKKYANFTYAKDYKSRNDLVAAHVILLGIGIGFLLLAYISGFTTCAVLNTVVLCTSSVCSLLGFITSLAGMIIFHIYDDIEIHELNYKPFIFFWSKDQTLKKNSSFKYGFSLILAWSGTGLCLVSTVLFWASYIAFMKVQQKKPKPRSPPDLKPYNRYNYSIDNYTYYGIKRPQKIENWRDIKISTGESLRNYYLENNEPTVNNNGLYQLSSRQGNAQYDQYHDYYNIYGSSGVYPY